MRVFNHKFTIQKYENLKDVKFRVKLKSVIKDWVLDNTDH